MASRVDKPTTVRPATRASIPYRFPATRLPISSLRSSSTEAVQRPIGPRWPSQSSRSIRSRAEAVRSRRTRAFFLLAVIAVLPAAAQDRPADTKTVLERLSAFDYATRTGAARAVRRMPPAQAVPALVQAARAHPDQYVRARALVLLTAFNDPNTPDLMRGLLSDRNDRVREVAYRWFELHP